MKGVGQNPRLLFDRKEVILPIVPLGNLATTTFRVINDGYDNLVLEDKIEQNLDGLTPKLDYIDGRRLGVTIKKVRINVTFKWNKPISFTKKLVFKGSDKKNYEIMVSGSIDNSIFTLQPHLLRLGKNDAI
jgi:hypothetical protein